MRVVLNILWTLQIFSDFHKNHAAKLPISPKEIKHETYNKVVLLGHTLIIKRHKILFKTWIGSNEVYVVA